MPLPAVRGMAYRSICIWACSYFLSAATVQGTVQKLHASMMQALKILRSKPEIHECLIWFVLNRFLYWNIVCDLYIHSFRLVIHTMLTTYEWYRDGVLIPREIQPFFYISEPLPEDRGNYTCKAINSQGNITSEQAKLEIPGKMNIIEFIWVRYTNFYLLIFDYKLYKN